MTRARLVRATAFAGCVLLAACDLGPDGPGDVAGSVTGDPGLGAAILDVTWPGATGFAGRGSTQVYSAPVAGVPDRYRVILVSPTGGDLPFTITVEDTNLRSPTVTVVEATGTDNLPRSATGLKAVFVR